MRDADVNAEADYSSYDTPVNMPVDSLVDTEDETVDYDQYRAMSIAAVVAFGWGVLSLAALMFPKLLFVPLVGTGFAVYALKNLQRHADELTGRRFARTGLLLCLFSFLGGATIAATLYATEVPPGYLRISFAELQPDPAHPGLPVSPRAMELDQKRVFIKGYVYPDDRSADLKRFILVPDMGTCCFGGQPALTDMIEVTLRDPLRTRFSYQRRKLGGTLKVDLKMKEISGLTGVYYQLDADYVR